jgi:hypothetical protein
MRLSERRHDGAATNNARRFNEVYNRPMTSTKNKLTVLTTVYPPISNADVRCECRADERSDRRIF